MSWESHSLKAPSPLLKADVELKVREELALAMVAALRGVHDAGWVHLDVKPSQFLFLPNLGVGELKLKLADFDAALQAHSDALIDRVTTR